MLPIHNGRKVQIAVIAAAVLLCSCAKQPEVEFKVRVFDNDMAVCRDHWGDSWIGNGSGSRVDRADDKIKLADRGKEGLVLDFSGENAKGGWWSACLARPMWQVMSLDSYKEKGYLEMSVKGASGGEEFVVGLADKSKLKREAMLPSPKFFAVTAEWQRVRIPLAEFSAVKQSLDLDRISHVIFRNGGKPGKFAFYVKDVSFRSELVEKAYPLIKVDQAGYAPAEIKIAKVSGIGIKGRAGNVFSIVDEDSARDVFSGRLKRVSARDRATGDAVFDADFTAFDRPGRYRVRVDGADIKSPVFCISDSAYEVVLRDSLRMYFYQRCGAALEPGYSGKWTHPSCHNDDAYLFSEGSKKIEAAGGWHDAGDYGKYVVNGGIAAGTLLAIYELCPGNFTDGQLGIPESGNSVPDILDEARREVEWFLKMQREDGAAYHKLAGEYVPVDRSPDRDFGKRFIMDISTPATANLAAVAAIASRTYGKFDPDFSKKCLDAAERAWVYLKSHPSDYPPRGYSDPVLDKGDIDGGEYGDDPQGKWTQGDRDERFWAACELFRATGKEEYHGYIRANYSLFKTGHAMNWQQLQNMGLYSYCMSASADTAIKKEIIKSMDRYGNGMLKAARASAYGSALHNYEYYWGSNTVALNYGVDLVYLYELTGDRRYRSAALDQLHYVLGRNVFGLSMVSGIGEKSIEKYYHTWFNNSDHDTLPPGFMVGGPNADNFRVSRYPGRCYKNVGYDFTVDEIAVNYNAPLVFVSGYFSAKK
ncbi:MAG: glycoside hydrolase family 9 protein [Dehalococcoidales bacterium]|jgi:endoglucanase